MYKIFQSFFLLIFLSLSVYSDEDLILDSVMNEMEFIAFKERVGQAVAKHPRFKSAQASLEAAFAQVKGSESYLRPQLSVILDSNNAISRKYADDPTNLVERSQADHKTNVRFTINQLLYDFGATRYDISRSEALAKASRAQLSSTILELLYQSIRSYIDVASYTNFEKVVEDSYLRHKEIKDRIKQRVDSGLSAGRELSRAEAREAEAFAKLTSVRQNLGIAISRFNELVKLIIFIGIKAFNISKSNVKNPSFIPLILSMLVAPIFLDPIDLGSSFLRTFEITKPNGIDPKR